MSAITSVTAVQPVVPAAGPAEPVPGVAATEAVRKSLNLQAEAAAQLLAALPKVQAPPLAESGLIGTQLNEIA